jgi:hypothetical protein
MPKRLERPDHTLMRDKVTQLFAGMHYRTEEFQQVSAVFDWQNVWPVIDADCDLTGEVVEPDESFARVYDDDAVIRKCVARAGGWELDGEEGTAWPPGMRDGGGDD